MLAAGAVRTSPDDRLIADLTKHPGFAAWRQAVEQDVEKKTVALARKWLLTDEAVDALEIERQRRYLKGRLDVVKQPDQIARKLEKE